jgi:hypothetical protein
MKTLTLILHETNVVIRDINYTPVIIKNEVDDGGR